MARYHRNEAREWAREHMNGVANVTIPTMTNDFKRINTKAARYDVETAIAVFAVALTGAIVLAGAALRMTPEPSPAE